MSRTPSIDPNPHAMVFRTDRSTGALAYANPFFIASTLYGQRQLLWQFVLREVQGRYRGSYLGMFWALFNPLLTLSVYTFVFSYVFKASWGGDEKLSKLTYAMNMFSGIIAYSVFSESITRAPVLIVQNPNYVKKVVFPLELLPLSLLGSALIHSLLSLVIALIGCAIAFGPPHLTLLFLPLVYIPLILFTAGLSWFLASLGVFLRDIGNVVAVIVQLLFFTTPITYPIEKVPERIRPLMWLNPLAAIVESFRRVVNQGLAPDWSSLGLVTLFSLFVAVLGYAWFMKIKRAFADVI